MALVSDIARECAKNTLMGIPAVRQRRLSKPRTAPQFSPEHLDLHTYFPLRRLEEIVGPVSGKSIVEFGPGDNLSSGFALLAAGAARYVSLDRFVPDYSSPTAKRWYRGVRDGWRTAFPRRPWPADLNPDDFPERYDDRVRHIAGGVEQAASPERFDIVTSWQVGEHVNDILAFATLTATLMKPNGVAVHRIDFGSHDCWRDYDDPFLFLRFPPRLWHIMGSNRGYPNRRRHHEFMEAWRTAGLTVECVEPRRFDMTRVSRLPSRIAGMPATSLELMDSIYVCRPGSLVARLTARPERGA